LVENSKCVSTFFLSLAQGREGPQKGENDPTKGDGERNGKKGSKKVKSSVNLIFRFVYRCARGGELSRGRKGELFLALTREGKKRNTTPVKSPYLVEIKRETLISHS